MSGSSGRNGESGKEGSGLLVDSDIFIDVLRGYEPARDYLKKLLTDGRALFFSAVTETELLAGSECNNVQKREEALHMLAYFDKMSVDNPLAQAAGDFRRKYPHLKTPDAIIAASAFLTHCILATKNAKDFEKIDGLNVQKPY